MNRSRLAHVLTLNLPLNERENLGEKWVSLTNLKKYKKNRKENKCKRNETHESQKQGLAKPLDFASF